MKDKIFRNTIVAASLATLLALPVVSFAGANAIIKDTSVKVKFADLDISKPQGVSVLYKRLQKASEEACGPISYIAAGNLSQLSRNKQCYRETLRSAVEKINNGALNKLHNG